jgi:hypothetical protein
MSDLFDDEDLKTRADSRDASHEPFGFGSSSSRKLGDRRHVRCLQD